MLTEGRVIAFRGLVRERIAYPSVTMPETCSLRLDPVRLQFQQCRIEIIHHDLSTPDVRVLSLHLTRLPDNEEGQLPHVYGLALGFRWFRPSLRMSLSSSSSATIFFSRAFSFSRLFSSDNWARPIPPNRFRQL